MSGYLAGALGLVVAAGTYLSAAVLGASVLSKMRSQDSRFSMFFGLALGIALIGTLNSYVSVLGLSHPAVILAITFMPLVLWPGRALPALMAVTASCRRLLGATAGVMLLRGIAFIYICYVAVHAIAPFYGADLAIYHLVVPREVLRSYGYVHNDFFFASGIPFGWHHFGLAAYFLGGPAGYLALSLLAFVLMLVVVHRCTAWLIGDLHESVLPDAAVIAVAIVIVGMLQGSVSNTDIPELYFQSVLLLYLFDRRQNLKAQDALLMGVVGGFCVAIKLIAAPTVFLVWLVLLWTARENRWRLGLAFVSAAIPVAATWQLVKLVATGSPLPIFMATLYLWGEPAEQLVQSVAPIWDAYGDWYKINFIRFLTGNMVALPVLVALGLLAFLRKVTVADVNARLLLAIGTANLVCIVLFSRRLDIIFHDRYLLLSYCLFAMAGVLMMRRLETPLPSLIGAGLPSKSLAIMFMVLLAGASLFGRNVWRDRQPDGTIAAAKAPHLFKQIRAGMQNFGLSPNDFRDAVTRYVAEKTPRSALIATTTVAPYHLDRRFMQLLPIAQEKIDLSGSPEEILSELRRLGVDYLHLPAYTSLNAWADAQMQPYFINLKRIADLPSVTIVAQQEVAPGVIHRLLKL